MRKHLCKFNGVAVMRKTRGIGDAASRRTVGLGSIVVCDRTLEARSLVDGQQKRTRPVGAGRHRASEIGREVSCGGSGAKRWRTELELAAVSLSRTTMGPPHLGQRQSGFGCLAGSFRFCDLGLHMGQSCSRCMSLFQNGQPCFSISCSHLGPNTFL